MSPMFVADTTRKPGSLSLNIEAMALPTSGCG
jgi:hypothetical protein